MPRTDTNGRSLESLLNYVLDGVGANDIQLALGVSAATYYRRKVQDDYPNAEELRLIARYFGLNFVSLLSVFGLLEGDNDTTGGRGGIPFTPVDAPRRRRPRSVTAAAWAVRVRRATYRIPWERSTTYAIIQLALAPRAHLPVLFSGLDGVKSGHHPSPLHQELLLQYG